jgi:hypothetical protein
MQMQRLRDVIVVVFGLLGILALARQVLEPNALEAVAIPTIRRDVEVGEVFTGSSTFVLVPNSSVTINNGSSARKVVVTFSAEARTLLGGIELGYDLDGAGCFKQAGPTAFSANAADDYEAATAVHVIPLGRGVHTIRPCFRTPTGDFVRLRDRVLIAEGGTK